MHRITPQALRTALLHVGRTCAKPGRLECACRRPVSP